MTIEDCALRLSVDREWLFSLFSIESGNDPAKFNPYSKAAGLIQFLPQTAIDMGTTTFDLVCMGYNEQLEYVFKYLAPYKGRFITFTDFYLAVFFPAAMGKPNDFIICTRRLSAALIAKQNRGFDRNRDNRITRGEIEYYLKQRFPNCYKRYGDIGF